MVTKLKPITQYIKDLSFENYAAQKNEFETSKLDVNLDLNIKKQQLNNNLIEITILALLEAKKFEKKKFIIEVKPKYQCKPPTKEPKRKTKKWLNEVRTWVINEAKWKYANEFCLDNGMEFKILTEDHLNIKYK